ncbi:MAG: isochorismatase family protein [candidate division KSB1 bacterium]|nr:isochorismatase family protein [candidate division KSB1 bacterium]MDZ7317579.1 isochorismatase family protein [candidate division KSB1 bacterium]MDZ7340186.1 isochorismatase family protein [candidate division KSB1 bacterium]
MVTIHLNSCALLIIDMQEYFRAIAAPILPAMISLIQCCRQAKLPIIYTRHAHRDPVSDGGMLANWWSELIIDGTAAAKLLPEIAPQVNEQVILKHRYSAFFETDLQAILQQRQIRQLIIGGVMTNLCCETTAREAFVRDYEVIFLSDGTATSHQDYQRATLLNLAYGFAHILTCQELCQLISVGVTTPLTHPLNRGNK